MSLLKNSNSDDAFLANVMRQVNSKPGNPDEKSVALFFSEFYRHAYIFPADDYSHVRDKAIRLHAEIGNPRADVVYVLGRCRKPGCGCDLHGGLESFLMVDGFLTAEMLSFTLDELEEFMRGIVWEVARLYKGTQPNAVR
jgi:hypothetical protein